LAVFPPGTGKTTLTTQVPLRFALPVLVLTHKLERGKPDVEDAGEAETVGWVKDVGIPENPGTAWIVGWVTRKPRTLP
jgi:hypothetical protein